MGTTAAVWNGEAFALDADGVAIRQGCITAEVGAQLYSGVIDAIPRLEEKAVVVDANGQWRTAFGIHQHSRLIAEYVSTTVPRCFAPELSGADWYLYQTKATAARVGGRGFPWHQDYWKWHHRDLMPQPAAISVAIALHDVGLLNSPLTFVRGSHQGGLVEGPTWHLDAGAALPDGSECVVVPLGAGDAVGFAALTVAAGRGCSRRS